MTEGNERALGMKVLIVDDELDTPTAEGRAVCALVDELVKAEVTVTKSISAGDGKCVILSDPSIQCTMIDWCLGDDNPKTHDKAKKLLRLIRSRNIHIPIFLMADRSIATLIPADVMALVDELVWVLEDTPTFIAGRVMAAMKRYSDHIEPPFNKALMDFAEVCEYSWHTPGHTGGTAFLKSPVGRAFFQYFGENLFRSDLSISVGELGSLLDHTGPIGESEKYAARVFGADRSYTVTNGTSASNRIIFMASVTRGDHVLVDRNCHKSIEQALIMTGAIPAYMKTSRNYLGLIGPIYPEDIGSEAVSRSISEHKLTVEPEFANEPAPSGAQENAITGKKLPVHAIITNSTYDGLCYNVRRVLEILGDSVSRIHFDEAWFGYARFNPLYKGRYGMFEKKRHRDAPTVFTTTSTHKLLAALSQASFIHVRDGMNPIPHDRFNESFMMHSSTSPQYAIIASNEVSAAMMSGTSGETLTRESIDEAIAFRQSMRKIFNDYRAKGKWFFDVWNADKVNGVDFENVSPKLLAEDQNCWVLHKNEEWHGFVDLEDGYAMLDPIKVSVVTPGVKLNGTLEEKGGIPAMLVTSYLDNRGIVVEKTTDFTILFLFSMGITKGKWGTLVNALLRFREDYENNTPLTEVLPDKVKIDPHHYENMGLGDLAREMFEEVRTLRLMELQKDIYKKIPKQDKTPNQSYQKLVHGKAKLMAIEDKDTANRTVATGIIPYPPGIPMLLSGENIGPSKRPHLEYLLALQKWDKKFNGFGHDIHGVENKGGKYYIHCLI
ncbi:Orn/Lys/Arg decarboxylase, major domain [uncultured archaeon]|nr:Orn/Lys/Arg decarboxylase, major domain [uncultured archaeon]